MVHTDLPMLIRVCCGSAEARTVDRILDNWTAHCVAVRDSLQRLIVEQQEQEVRRVRLCRKGTSGSRVTVPPVLAVGLGGGRPAPPTRASEWRERPSRLLLGQLNSPI